MNERSEKSKQAKSASKKAEKVPIMYHMKNDSIEFDTEEFTMESPAKVKF